MKTIGVLGGTGWSSTIQYYTLLNQMVNERLGGHHSADITLKSIDYDTIMVAYGKDHETIKTELKKCIQTLLSYHPDCFLICCNSLHRYYNEIAKEFDTNIPIMHAVDLTVEHLQSNGFKKVLFLATKFTMEDPFFTSKIDAAGIECIIPTEEERLEIARIHTEELMHNKVSATSKEFFVGLINASGAEAAVLACTEFSIAVTSEDVEVPLIDPSYLQCKAAIEFALG